MRDYVYFYHIATYTIQVNIALNRMYISSRVVNTVLSWGLIVYKLGASCVKFGGE